MKSAGTWALAFLALLATSALTVANAAPRTAMVPDSGKPSARVKQHWQAVSQRNLVHLLRCLEQVSARQATRALESCNAALALDTSNPGAYKLRGEAYLLLGRPAAGLADFDTAIRLDRKDPESLAGRGDALRDLQQYRPALAAYTSAMQLSPRDARLWNARCWARGIAGIELITAIADCSHAIALANNFAPAYDSRGFVRLRLGQYDLAIRDYTAALALQPNYALAQFGRGVARWRLGQRAAARSDLVQARAHDASVDTRFRSYGISLTGLPPSYSDCRHTHCARPVPSLIPSPRKAPPDDGNLRSAAR